jgi:hypothetical protein
MHFAPGHKVDEFLNRYEEFAKANPGVSIKQWVRDHYAEEKPGREATWYIEGC